MPSRNHALWAGLFVVGGLLLFAVGLFLIGDRRLLFERHYEIETALARVTGLQVGTAVDVAGLRAGEITRIDVPARPSDPFVIRLRIRDDVAHLIRTDSVAAVQMDGLVGNAFIQVGPGSNDAAIIAPGGRIRGTSLVEFSDVLLQANDTMATFQKAVDDVAGEVTTTLDALNGTISGVNDVVSEVQDGVRTINVAAVRVLDQVESTTAETSDIIAAVRQGRGTLGKLLNDTALYDSARTTVDRVAETAEQIRATSVDVRENVTRILRPGGVADSLIADTRSTAGAAQELLSDLAEETEALKRNWLFRGFFRGRGFYDIDDLTPGEYRTFATDASERRAVRIWLAANQLFTADASGEEQLSDEGLRRLDLAMGTLLDYRRDSTLVVEGYATGDSISAQHLRSDARARLVRNRLVKRFDRDTATTGALGLGDDARDSPSGDGHWNGVALTIFVPN